MRSHLTAAALCAILFAPASRAQDDVPQPVSRTVVEPPAQPAPEQPAAAQPAPAQPPAAAPPNAVRALPPAVRSEVGFSVRLGGAETDRLLLGTSVGGASGPFMVGFSLDGTVDVEGSGRHHEDDDDDDGWRDWCRVRADGRCTNRADLAMAGYLGLRHRTGPVLGSAPLRLELAGELGWQWSLVEERMPEGVWSDATRAFPIAGLRAQVGLTFFRHATFGVGGYVRQGLAGRVCVDTEGGCTKVGGTTGGVYFFGGGDWWVGG